MVENIVVGFTSKKKKTCTLGHMLGSGAVQAEPSELMKHQHLVKSMKDLQSHLKSLFFDQVKPSAKKHKYVIQDIEHLFVTTEILLKTHFGETFRRVQEQEEEEDSIKIELNNEEVELQQIEELQGKPQDELMQIQSQTLVIDPQSP